MARVLVVGCGCRGRQLAAALRREGHAVRGTTRDETRAAEIEATGAEAAVADPNRLATLLPCLSGVSVICWLMGSATGDAELVAAIHGPRIGSLVEKLVDTPVRGLVYEAAGSVEGSHLERGAAIVRAAGETYRMPIAIVEAHPGEHDRWLGAMLAGVGRVLA